MSRPLAAAALAALLCAPLSGEVLILDAWLVDETYAIQDATFIPSAGTNRIVVVFLSAEKNGGGAENGPIEIDSVNLGDQTLVELFDFTVGAPTAYHNVNWVGYLLEDEIVARTGDALTITYTSPLGDPDNPFDEPKIHYASYEHVDQTTPIVSSNNNTITNSATCSTGNVMAGFGDKIIGFGVLGQGDVTTGWPSGWTQETTTNGPTNGHESAAHHRTATTATTENPGFTASASTSRQACSALVLNFTVPASTPVTLSSFRAVASGGGVDFEWSTATEAGNVGFRLYALTESGWRRVSEEIHRSPVLDSIEPQRYHYRAEDLEATSFYIEDLDVFGDSDIHGPFGLQEIHGRAEMPARAIDWPEIRRQHESAPHPQRRLMSTAAARTTGLQRVDLQVDRDGLYRVTYEQLEAAGIAVESVRPDRIGLENRGELVALYVGRDDAGGAPSGSRRFGPGWYVEFFGQALDSLYSKTNVYQLVLGTTRSKLVQVNEKAPSLTRRAVKYYLETAAVERDLVYSFASTNGDPWFDTRFLAFDGKPVSEVFKIELDEVAVGADEGQLRVSTWGVTSWPTSRDHHLIARFNGRRVANGRFDGQRSYEVDVALGSGDLREGENTLRLVVPGDTGVPWDIVALDRFAVTYPRRFIARGDRLSFEASGRVFEVKGLSSPRVVVYRLREGEVTKLGGSVVIGSGGDYRVRLRGGAEARYLVSAESALLEPGIRPARTGTGYLTRGLADLLVISHPDFLSGLDSLVSAREAEGLSVRVADVDDVYARFGHGIFDATAIRSYVKHAYRNMDTRYVLLVGGDSYDYHDHLGIGAISFIPSLYAQTDSIVRFTPVDPLYGDVDGDGVPEVAVGRFPVRTLSELDSVVGKTLQYQNRSYRRTAVFAADGVDGSGASFSPLSNELMGQLPRRWRVTRAYVADEGLETARRRLLRRVNKGVALTTYVGHSGPTVWTFAGLFDIDDAENLKNEGLPTVVMQWGCWNTYYVSPTSDSLGHALMLSGDRGAAAVLGASTLTLVSSDRALGELFVPKMARAGVRLGEALVAAKQELAEIEPDRKDVILGWTLLGDPTLVIEPGR